MLLRGTSVCQMFASMMLPQREQYQYWDRTSLLLLPAACSRAWSQTVVQTLASSTVSAESSSRAAQQAPKRRDRSRWSHTNKAAAIPRATAVQQLLRIQDEGAFIKGVSGLASPDAADGVSGQRSSRAVTELVAGVTRYRRRLDQTIAHLTGRAIAKLDPVAREILRVGLYELMELELADHAIGSHVEIVRAMGSPHLAGFVNGVLRAAVRQRAAGLLFQPPRRVETGDAGPDELATWFSHPTWMVERWLTRYGYAGTVALMQHNNRSGQELRSICCLRRPAYGIRLNCSLLEMSTERFVEGAKSRGIEAEVSPYLPAEFVRVHNNMQRLIQDGHLAQGQCQVQDEAAGAVVAFMDPQPGELILDACAAPGGKATFIAHRMRGEGRLLATDVSGSRLEPLRDAVVNQRLDSLVTVQVLDITDHAAVAASRALPTSGFDRVLVDAPCSGTGVLAKRADLRWRRQLSDLTDLTALQDSLLDAAAELVKPGGMLVYSTCSIEPEENEDRAIAFVKRHPQFSLEKPLDSLLAVLVQQGMLRVSPHQHGIDGAYAARLRRRGSC